MSKAAINDVQKALNAIRSAVTKEDRDTQLATLALLNSTSDSIINTARKLGDAQTKAKTKTQKVPIPQTKVVKQQSPQQQTSRGREREERDAAAKKPQPPLTPQQQREQ
ncbi:hypothetical protein BBH56_09470 [Spiribacter roseus]|uniref:hypothetical protein n=1 Tax=Spiribacter roseus TaxID=1855875 RepID=UPI000F70A2EE|nr:hypothetical protein BBH56_09470 [Spiribacter roseus]